jgi:hypothetical protein
VHPTADTQRFRCEKDILADHRRLAEHEVASLAFKGRQLRGIFAYRAIPGIPRRSVAAAWPGFIETPRRSPERVEGPQYTWGLYEPTPIAPKPGTATVPVPKVSPPTERSEAERIYEEAMRRMVFPL